MTATKRNRGRKVEPIYKHPNVSRTNYLAAKRFITEMQKKPIILINAHACICPQSGECMGEPTRFSFEIPNNIYLFSFITPGSFFCYPNPEKMVLNERAELHKFFYIHSESDITYEKSVGKTKRSLYSGFRRATGAPAGKEPVLYPDINLTFNEYTKVGKKKVLVDEDENIYGAYRIDDLPDDVDTTYFRNKNSLVKQDANQPHGNWFLKDVIQECLRKLRVHSAAFVLTSCYSRCHKETPQKNMDRAARIVEDAHNLYTNLKPVLTAEELAKMAGSFPNSNLVPYNFGGPQVPEAMEFAEIKHMHELGVTNANVYLGPLAPMIHQEEKEEITKYLASTSTK